MAHLFHRIENQWSPVPLTGDVFSLRGAVLRRAGADEADWLLLTSPSVTARVNGVPVALAIRALHNRDEIHLPGTPPMFFSTEKLVTVEPYTGPAGGKCPRCTKEIERDSPAVRCGSCCSWYHQSGTRTCYTYGGDGAICVTCANDAVVSDKFSWTPDEF